jgi:hypothetical protein
MAITKKSSRQEQVVGYQVVNATEFATTVIGTGTPVTAHALQLPAGAIITGGDLIVVTPFNTEGVRSHGTLTVASTYTVSDAETVTIGAQVYTFKTALSTGPAVAYEVLIGASDDTALTNLDKAINLTGTAGTDYGVGTLINAKVSAAHVGGTHVLTVTSLVATAANDAVATTETMALGSWGAATLVDYVVPADTITVKVGSNTYLTATSVDAIGRAALTPIGTATSTLTYVDVIWGAASTTTLAPTAGSFILDIQYYVLNRAQFSEG